MSSPLRWEFPGGKVEQDEDPRAALRREVLEELDVVVDVGEWLARGEADGPSRRIRLDVYAARIEAGEVRAREHAGVGWFDVAGLSALDWADPDVPVLPAVLQLLDAVSVSALVQPRCSS